MSKPWIWQRPDWPHFDYDEAALAPEIETFDRNNQLTLKEIIKLETSDTEELIVSLKGREALETSRIEGETYRYKSLKESFRVHASITSKDGLPLRPKTIKSQSDQDRRSGISEMMATLYRKYANELSHDTLHSWNHMILGNRTEGAGAYRDYADAMQVKSFTSGKDEIDFEAPPASHINNPITKEMNQFVEWYNDTGPNGKNPLHPVIRAGLAHLYFVTVHPYTDGNGRIARALAIKAISEHNNEPTLVSLSHAISDSKTDYYNALKAATKDHDVNAWLKYFAKTVVRGQEITQEKIYFAALSNLHQQNDTLNHRQTDALDAIIESRFGGAEGKPVVKKPDKFSVSDYITINRASLKEAADQYGISPKDLAERELIEMQKQGIIEETPSNGGVRYQIVFSEISGLSDYMPLPKRQDNPTSVGNNTQSAQKYAM